MLKPYNRADVQFELRHEIGAEGRNSQVYVAYDPQLDAELVIKKIDKTVLALDEYFRESSLLYGSSHSNIVPIHYACSDQDYVYLAMPYFPRGSLRALMNQRFLTVREIVIFSTQLLSGLHHIHSKRLVHFDVKPDNVLISERGEALLSDFGLTRAQALNGLAGQDQLYGKMVPPEAFDTDEFDHRFDIYQAGLTMYRMCVGDHAFYRHYESYCVNGTVDRHAFRHAVRNAQFPNRDADAFPAHIPDRLITAIRKCLETDLNERYASANDVVNELAPIDGKLLDWQYTSDTQGQSWRKTAEGYEIALSLDGQRQSTATKQRVNGNARRIVDYCQPALGRQATKRFLRGH